MILSIIFLKRKLIILGRCSIFRLIPLNEDQVSKEFFPNNIKKWKEKIYMRRTNYRGITIKSFQFG
jgi:hypothetical protein